MSNDPIKPYQKGGKTFYGFQVYTGINPKTGKPSKTRRKGFTTKTKAKKALLDIKQQVAEGTYWEVKKEDKTLEEVFEEWYSLKRNELKPSTLKRIKIYFSHLKNIHGLYVKKLTTVDIQSAITQSSEAIHSRKDKLTIVKQVLDYALHEGYITRNPAYNIPQFVDNTIKEKKRQFLTLDELNQILDDAKERNYKYYVIIRLLAFSGLRVGELCALEWNDFHDGVISVYKTQTLDENGRFTIGTPKTKSSIRKVPLDLETVEILENFQKFPHHTPYIFENNKSTYLSTHSVFKFMKTHYNIHPHILRHTHASLLFKAGVNPKVIQKRLGHSSFNMTMDVYTHLFENDETDNIEKFFDFIK